MSLAPPHTSRFFRIAEGLAGLLRSKVFRSSSRFTFAGSDYPYFNHRFNWTWTNERAVEIPIILRCIEQSRGKRILEVGNVLSHYLPVAHDVVDKYEKAEGVINQDIAGFKAEHPYDLIVSISTLEHVGWDEQPREAEKPIRALENLIGCLGQGGLLVATMPIGYNPELDRLLGEGRLSFSVVRHLKRVSRANDWAEAQWEEVRGVRYNKPFPAANAIAVGFYEREAGGTPAVLATP
jgi:SAM-dependent methyltransferase